MIRIFWPFLALNLSTPRQKGIRLASFSALKNSHVPWRVVVVAIALHTLCRKPLVLYPIEAGTSPIASSESKEPRNRVRGGCWETTDVKPLELASLLF